MKYSESNKPIVCMQTNSTCYKNTTVMIPRGVLWHDTGAECVNVPASSLRYSYYVETDPSDWVIGPPIEDDGDNRFATKIWSVWSNFPMLDTTDTIIMEASAPQPVYL